MDKFNYNQLTETEKIDAYRMFENATHRNRATKNIDDAIKQVLAEESVKQDVTLNSIYLFLDLTKNSEASFPYS